MLLFSLSLLVFWLSPTTWAAAHKIPRVPRSPTPYRSLTPLLDTPWTNEARTNPWPEHPRPLLYREQWQTLNGIWTFQSAFGSQELAKPPALPLGEEVLIPSCMEGAISGIMRLGLTYMWLGTNFSLPVGWPSGQRVLLHFEAVDYEATVFLNGDKVGFNRGGYFRFSIDITDKIRDGSNELLVFVFDPTDQAPYHIPIGKQTIDPSHIFYTPCSGIWQTVWLERVPSNYVTSIDLSADMYGGVSGTVHSSTRQSSTVNISLCDKNGVIVATQQVNADQPFSFTIVPLPQLWTPDSPNLYDISVIMGDDTVRSYTGFRTISSASVKGVQRPLLNGKFVFQFGTLDQGYWPDGIYLPPTLEAMKYDLYQLKNLSMNMVRKHIKIEPDLFYQACDQIGLLVIQDMPSMKATINEHTEPLEAADQAEFERQIELMVKEHKSYPSIVSWVIYNEGWGQIRNAYHPEVGIAARVRELDPTRLINAVTGWFDHGAGDFSDNHHYAEPQCGTPFSSLPSSPYDPARIGIQGEFGGVGHIPDPQHLWPVQKAIDGITQTYEINKGLDAYNYRSHVLLNLLRDQVERFACSAAVWTQTTDVEGEVNGLMTYDRRVLRVYSAQWIKDIQALYDAAEARA